MLTALLLAGAEKLINLALQTDEVTQAGLDPLAGKVLRVNIDKPMISLDVFFNNEHIRFEPVKEEGIFETKSQSDNSQQGTAHLPKPDCIIHVANVAELMNLMREPEGNLPIEGDYKILMHLKQLIAGFDPDIIGKLEPFIGTPLASQLEVLIYQLKGQWKHTAKDKFNDVADWANKVAGNVKPDPEDLAETNDLKQQLLKLRADVEREQARLDAIKEEQKQYQKQLAQSIQEKTEPAEDHQEEK